MIGIGEFHHKDHALYPLRMERAAYRTLVAMVFRTLATQCVGVGQGAPRSYRHHIVDTCRTLRRHLLNADAQWHVLEHF